MKSIFIGKIVSVLRVLLVNYPKRWSLRELCRDAKVSLRWASVAANELIQERLAVRNSSRSELKVMMPSDILKRWATVNNFTSRTKFIEYYSQEQDVTKFIEKFKDKTGPEYALTCLAGALKVAPYVRPSNIHVYVKTKEDAIKWADLLSLTPVEGNGNVKFAIANDEGVFYGLQKVDGVNVVSLVQLYVDLLNYPARGEEAAQPVLKVIENKWKKAKE